MNTKPIIVVSGLPRSGTSMMMKMLEAGGVPVIMDHQRTADEDNPKGYYEFEKVKQLPDNATWLNEAGGKAVKMVSMLLYKLPSGFDYKIIFMRRTMSEIIASQHKMLARKGLNPSAANDEEAANLFAQHLQNITNWLQQQKNMSVSYPWYHDILHSSQDQIQAINTFLGGQLNTTAMANVVDQALYRNRVV